MAHAVKRLSKSILEEPLLLLPQRLEEISEYLDSRTTEDLYLASQEAAKLAMGDSESSQDYLAETTVGVLNIEGSITYKPTGFEALCGGVSYQSLISQTETLCSMKEIDTILMKVDSGGGTAFRCFESANRIKALAQQSGKKLIAYIDGMAASAAYALTSVADEVILNPDSMAGSIGVVVRLTDTSKAEQEAGYKTIYVTAGDSKVPFNEDGGFREDYLADIQDRVSDLYGKFITHVAEARGISEEAVRNTEAKVFSAEKALELGLVDKIMEGEEFYTYLADLSNDSTEEEAKSMGNSNVTVIKVETDDNSSNLTTQSEKDKLMSDTEKTELSVDAAKLAEFNEMQEKMKGFEALQEKLAQFEAKEQAQAQEALSASLDAFTFVTEDKEQLVAFLSNDKVETSHKSLLNTVLEKAQASIGEVTEQAATQIAEAQAETEQVKEEKEQLKTEFAKPVASTEQPAEAMDFASQLKAKVKEQKAAKAAKA